MILIILLGVLYLFCLNKENGDIGKMEQFNIFLWSVSNYYERTYYQYYQQDIYFTFFRVMLSGKVKPDIDLSESEVINLTPPGP